MANPVYNAMGGGAPSIPQMIQQLKTNPSQLLAKRFNLPQGMAADPNAIIQHLMQTGQISQNQLNAAYQWVQEYLIK